MPEPTDIDRLPPTQWLALETLAARYRLGDNSWIFPAGAGRAIQELSDLGLVNLLSGCSRRIRASLTERGRAAVTTSAYRPANGGIERLRSALALIAEFAGGKADLVPGMGSVAEIARKALDGGPS